jgi:hypothetical protein
MASIVLLFDFEGFRASICFDSARFHFQHARANVNLWHTVYALRLKCSVVDMCRHACRFQALILQVGPHLPQPVDFVGLADLAAHVVGNKVKLAYLVA